MREVILRPDAEADIENATDYTIELLATDALRHPLYETVHPGLRRKRSGMHHIYYVASKERVEVLNIIHVQRDPGLHLKVESWDSGD